MLKVIQGGFKGTKGLFQTFIDWLKFHFHIHNYVEIEWGHIRNTDKVVGNYYINECSLCKKKRVDRIYAGGL